MFNRLVTAFNRLFILWIILGGLSAFFFPTLFIPLKKYMEFFFGLTMLGVGMVLNPSDFINIFKDIKTVLIGVTAQFSIMPFSAALIAMLFQLPKEFTLGLILTGSAPGAMASNVLSFLAGADVAYSVSLTTVSTFLAPVLTPALTMFLADTLFEIPFWNMFFSVVRMVLIPVVVGILLRRRFQNKIEPLTRIFPAISTLFITFICALVIALNKAYIMQIDLRIFIAVFILNISGLSLGYLVGNAFHFHTLRKRALSIEIGMQNAGLGSVLALKHFNEKTALPAVIFVFICILTASILVPIWSKSSIFYKENQII